MQPYHYFYIKTQINHLIDAYQSVNDPTTIKTFEGLTLEKIRQIDAANTPEMEALLEKVMHQNMTKAKADVFLEEFKASVIPFPEPSTKQIEKAFRKIKKLKPPIFATLDLHECSYIGWNDPGTQKKFILCYQDQKLIGLSGSLAPEIKKGFCPICQHESNVAMFLMTTKSAGDGSYTKKGNYICADSQKCNQQMTSRDGLDHFVESILGK